MTEKALKDHIAALEAELARYAANYGLTDEARRLLAGGKTNAIASG